MTFTMGFKNNGYSKTKNIFPPVFRNNSSPAIIEPPPTIWAEKNNSLQIVMRLNFYTCEHR